ncbi:MAG: hypothetical protein FWC03_00540 [Treponema sp.]|nr:hypothetical protein [Treponema sp.]
MANNKLDITFETKCYENDWEYLLKTQHLNKMINNCNVNFQCKQLIINNVNDFKMVERYAKLKIEENIIDSYYYVDDFISDALIYFDINKDSFGKGYYYSSAELVGLYLSKTKYHLHFSSDTFLPQKGNWIENACNILENNSIFAVANPTWNFDYKVVKKESTGEINDFYICRGFSDQCYLVKTDTFKQKIYNYKHPASDRYPVYAGELFEKRVDSFMMVKDLYRITSSKTSYIHYNFPKKNKNVFFILILNSNLYFYYCYLSLKCRYVINLIKKIIKRIIRYE